MKNLPHLRRWGAVALWAAVIFTLSAQPGSRVPGRFGSLAHFVEYAILAVLVFRAIALTRDRRFAAIAAVVLSSAYAVSDEWHQSFVPMRVPDVADWVVDTVGAIAGVAAWLLLTRVTRGRRGP